MKSFRSSFSKIGLTVGAALPLLVGTACHQKSSDDYLWILLLGGGYSYSGGSTGGGSTYYGWYDAYGYRCGALGPGCDYYYNGSKIDVSADPYYYSSSGWSYYYSNYYGTWVDESPSGIIYDDYYGDALNEGNEVSDGFDIISDVALANKKRDQAFGHYFAQKFSLSEEQGTKIAKTVSDYGSLKKRTAADMADFTKRLYGVDFGKVISAVDELKSGNKAPMNEVLEAVAQNWNTTPEQAKRVGMELHGHLLKDLGIEDGGI